MLATEKVGNNKKTIITNKKIFFIKFPPLKKNSWRKEYVLKNVKGDKTFIKIVLFPFVKSIAKEGYFLYLIPIKF